MTRRLTGDERDARRRVEAGFDDRYEIPVRLRAALLVRVLAWQRRTNASCDDVRTVTASLGIDDQSTVDYVNSHLCRMMQQLTVTTR